MIQAPLERGAMLSETRLPGRTVMVALALECSGAGKGMPRPGWFFVHAPELGDWIVISQWEAARLLGTRLPLRLRSSALDGAHYQRLRAFLEFLLSWRSLARLAPAPAATPIYRADIDG